jgi:hypothetical protein
VRWDSKEGLSHDFHQNSESLRFGRFRKSLLSSEVGESQIPKVLQALIFVITLRVSDSDGFAILDFHQNSESLRLRRFYPEDGDPDAP